MKKWIFSLALVLSCNTSVSIPENMMNHAHDHAPGKFMPGEAEYVAPESVKTRYLSVKGMQIKGFTNSGEKKLQEAFRLLELAVNSEEFKDRLLNFKNTDGDRSFKSNKGLTNEEIYEIFMEGRETLQPDTPGEMNFYLKQYYRPWSRVIGYTYATTNVININYRFFKDYKPYNVAANLAHEWVHKIGFGHVSAQEHDSVPYALGYILGDIAEKIYYSNRLH